MNHMTAEDHAFLKELAKTLVEDPTQVTESVDTTASQSVRAANWLDDMPDEFEIDFKFDVEAEIDRMERRIQEAAAHPVPATAPKVPGGGQQFGRPKY